MASPFALTCETPTVDPGAFTVERANRAIPFVERVVADVRDTYGSIVDLRRRLENARSESDARTAERDYEREMDRLGDLVDELHLVGVELKDFEGGEIEFPANAMGDDVVFCWKPGQLAIECWRDADAGSPRRPIASLPAAA